MNDLARFVYSSPFNLGEHPEPSDGVFTGRFYRNGQGCWVPEGWYQEPTITMRNVHTNEKVTMCVRSSVADEFTEINLQKV